MHCSIVTILLNVAVLAGNIFIPVSSSSAKMDSENGIFLNRALKRPWDSDNLSSDDIRCYCNLPICITTSYMCRTAANGGCFSEVRESADDDDLPARHGCMELLLGDNDKHLKCNLEGGKHNQIRSSTALLRCCQEDMCNHIDNPDNKRFKADSRSRGEGVHSRASQSAEDMHTLHETVIYSSESRPVYPDNGESQDEVWFKAATIAITVCGAIILFVLIVTAIRMLRSDGRGGDTTSKLGTGSGSPSCNGRKIILDFGDAYNQVYGGSSQQSNIKHVPLLKVDDGLPPSYTIYPSPNHHQLQNFQQTTTKVCGDSKNEAQAKKNQIKSLEYTLLPQSCHEGVQKPINTDVATSPAYRDVNLSPTLHGRVRPDIAMDNKTYEKDMLAAVPPNWTNNSTNNSYGV
uniref:Putative activin a type ib receptor serine/threonine protein kinase n=1 Tax=Phlebotomus kandelakii TaxID=1109342 RepID=A0A6B2E4K0_9DIPT